MIFWVLVLGGKFAFAYFLQVRIRIFVVIPRLIGIELGLVLLNNTDQAIGVTDEDYY